MTANALLAAADFVQRKVEMAGPTTEKGTMSSSGGAGGGIISTMLGSNGYSWKQFESDVLEHAPELKWKPGGKGAVEQYHRMRTDAQINGIYLALTLPVRRYNYFIIPNGAPDSMVQRIARNYNLPVQGQENQPRRRTKRRFVFDAHLRQALLALIYGHMFFEQVGDNDPKEGWILRKLAPRMPQSIQEINVDKKDGGLANIVQRGMGVTTGGRKRTIEVNRLIAYIWEQEGADWAGRSMLRPIYKNFLLKDTVLRVGAINIERAGGVPVIEGPKGATPKDLAELGKMARAFRVGANAGGAIPNGAQLTLARAAGGEEAVNYIKLMNEEMSRGLLTMFMNLGQATTGSYALGSSLIDYALNTQEIIADWFCGIFNEHMIEDDVDWNEGEVSDTVPLLGYKRTDDRQMSLRDLATLVQQGAITVDDELESWLRDEYRMPRFDPESSTVRPVPGAGSPPSEPGGPSPLVDGTIEAAIEEIKQANEEHVRRVLAEAA